MILVDSLVTPHSLADSREWVGIAHSQFHRRRFVPELHHHRASL